MRNTGGASPVVRDARAGRAGLVWQTLALMVAGKLGWLVLTREEDLAAYAAVALLLAVTGLLAFSLVRWRRARTAAADTDQRKPRSKG